MKEHPIIFDGEMVRAILEGRKTQTRRFNGLEKINKEPNAWIGSQRPCSSDGKYSFTREHGPAEQIRITFPYGQVGDRLWVRETWTNAGHENWYKATDEVKGKFKWTPSIHMPRWASRIPLEITGIRVERLQDISEEDAIAEGIEFWEDRFHDDAQDYYKDYMSKPHELHDPRPAFTCPVRSFQSLWDSIYVAYHYDRNPWVWVIEFKRV